MKIIVHFLWRKRKYARICCRLLAMGLDLLHDAFHDESLLLLYLMTLKSERVILHKIGLGSMAPRSLLNSTSLVLEEA